MNKQHEHYHEHEQLYIYSTYYIRNIITVPVFLRMLRKKEWKNSCRDSSKIPGDYIYFDPLVFQVFHIVVSGSLHPKWLYGPETSLVDSEAVGEVDDHQQPYAIYNLKVSTYMYDNMTYDILYCALMIQINVNCEVEKQ